MWVSIIAFIGMMGVVTGAPDPVFSIYLNVTGWSPLLFMTDGWDMDAGTGALSSANATWGETGTALLWMIGTSYVPYGTIADLEPGMERSPGYITYQWGQGTSASQLLHQYPEVGVIAEPNRIQLGPYDIYVRPEANTTITIHYIIVEMPIATYA